MHALADNTTVQSDSPAVEFDRDGYLIDQYDWNKTLAHELARQEGIAALSSKHWLVIDYVRDYYRRLNAMPPPRRVCRQLGVEGHDIKALFGSCLAVWRISGLPNPGDEVRAHLH